MAHRRVKDVSYDEDDLDYDEADAEETNGTSAEDKERLVQGTIDVKAALGDLRSFVTDDEVQDALWYYYYDIAKTVTYLQKKSGQPAEQVAPSKKSKAPSKFDQAVQSMQGASITTGDATAGPPLWAQARSISMADFFADTPFLGVPQGRLGDITMVPRFPRGGLLGGSGKPSKLAALAASRKKAADEKRKAETGATSTLKPEKAQSDVLGRFEKRQKLDDDRIEETRHGVQSMSIKSKAEQARDDPSDRRRAHSTRGVPAKMNESMAKTEPMHLDATSTSELDHADKLVNLIAAPSALADSLFSRPEASISAEARRQHLEHVLPLLLQPLDVQEADRNPFSGPSPDDVVHNAQKGKGAKPASQQNAKKTASKNATDGIADLKLDEEKSIGATTSEKIKSKIFDIAAEYAKSGHKRSANFVVVGHVDHGKSTLMGRLLYDTGSHITERAFSKLASSAAAAGKSSFSYAWLMDSTSEERSRGITVDIAQTAFSTSDCDFTILDAPGHKDFVPNMIAGASQADFAVLVVDASKGEFEKGLEGGGQTKEHALLIRGLGVGRVVVAVNKMDNVGWNEERFREVQGQLVAFLYKVGFKQDNVQCVPCAGLTGENVACRAPSSTKEDSGRSKSKSDSSAATAVASEPRDNFVWYTGPTLLSRLSDFAPPIDRHAALIAKPFRLGISDIFRGSITQPLSISGRIEQGSVQAGDVLMAMPATETCVVKRVDVDVGSAARSAHETEAQTEYAITGQIATLHLADIDAMHLRLGDVLCSAANPVQNVTSFTAKVLAFDHLVPGAVDCHRGRAHCAATLSKLLEVVVAADKGKDGPATTKRPRVIKPGQIARVVVELERPLPLETRTRIVLRNEGATVAAGLVDSVEAAR